MMVMRMMKRKPSSSHEQRILLGNFNPVFSTTLYTPKIMVHFLISSHVINVMSKVTHYVYFKGDDLFSHNRLIVLIVDIDCS